MLRRFLWILEQFIDVAKQTCITKDNAPVDIDLLIYLKVTDPEKVITQVQNFKQAAVDIATTTLSAEGQARALELLNGATSKLGQNALLLQYLDALKAIATSPSTKIVMPLEVLTFLQNLINEVGGLKLYLFSTSKHLQLGVCSGLWPRRSLLKSVASVKYNRLRR